MIFKDVERRIKESRQKLKLLTEDTQAHKDEYVKLCAFNTVLNYLKSDKWCKRPSTSERVRVSLSKGYQEASRIYGCSVNSIKSSVYNASIKIEQTIGFDVLSEIEEGGSNLTEAMALFELRTSGVAVDSIMPTFLYDYLPEDWKFYKLKKDNLISALNTIKAVSEQNLRRSILACDEQTLSCIFYILSSKDSRHIPRQGLFYSYIMGELSEEVLKQRLGEME